MLYCKYSPWGKREKGLGKPRRADLTPAPSPWQGEGKIVLLLIRDKVKEFVLPARNWQGEGKLLCDSL
jgi:hypothetical protein